MAEMALKCSSVRTFTELFPVICMLTLSTGFVGYDQYLDTIIVAHQGTDKKSCKTFLFGTDRGSGR